MQQIAYGCDTDTCTAMASCSIHYTYDSHMAPPGSAVNDLSNKEAADYSNNIEFYPDPEVLGLSIPRFCAAITQASQALQKPSCVCNSAVAAVVSL